ncbi:MAG TPA: Ig-like domain-containing protein [Candidatus Angelobacter sp.]|nr:Ig-like domain-containing protein [Candidatus Angelobacter sp.]
MKVKLIAVTVVLLGLIVAGCGGGGNNSTNNRPNPTPTPAPTSSPTPSPSPTPTPAPASLTALQVTPGTMSIGAGATQQFTATGVFSDNSKKDMTASVQWSSSAAAIASIDASGLAHAVDSGTVMITATSGAIQGTASLSITVAVVNLNAIAISPAASSIPVNTSQQFTATGTYSDGTSRDLTALVTWASSANGVATIDVNGMAAGVAAGTVNISATLGAVTSSTTLTVNAPAIASIAVTPVGLTLGIGIHQQYTATAIYTDGSSQDLSSAVTWSSSAQSVATVDNTGLATTVAAGTTTITATVGAFSDTSTLTVVAANLISIQVTPANPSIALGTNVQLTATGSFDDGSTQQLTNVTWSSSDVNIASINSSGLATSTGTGSVTISATSGTVSGTVSLSVTAATLQSIAVTPANSSMSIGTTRQFTATGTFSDSSTQDITGSVLWGSSNPAAATINNQGLATSAATGVTVISATVGSVVGNTNLNVSNAKLVSITISPSNPRIEQGTLLKFTASGTFSDNSVATNLSGLSWKSSKPSIASMRSSGLAFGKKLGSVTITASSSGVSATTTLTVSNGTLTSIAITPANPSVAVNSTQQFTATGTFSDNSTQDVTFNTHWSSSVSSVATIANGPNGAGLATITAAGSTVIGGNSGGITAQTTVTAK